MTAEDRTKMSTRLNWRFRVGEFVVIVVGVLMALWVDELREARVNAELEVEYLESLVIDLDADLAQFDETGSGPSMTPASQMCWTPTYDWAFCSGRKALDKGSRRAPS